MFGARNFFLTAARAVIDPLFDYVTLLLTGNGTNGAQNNTFLDSSTNNFTITRNGNTTQGTFTPYGANWSNYFDGSGDFLTQSSVSLGSGSFTVEMWVFLTSLPNAQNALFSCGTSDGITNCIWYINSSRNLILYAGSDVATTSATVPLNEWVHLAIVRNGTSVTNYINGVSSGTGTTSRNFSSTPFQVFQGYGGISASPVGYVSNLRAVVGTAVYTSNFTPPTAPLTAITNTQLLTCQSNRFIDNSTNNFTITRNGDVSVQRFSPFNPTTPYAAATIGGSGYFDGNGDTLSIASNAAFGFGTGDFTVELFVYCSFNGAVQEFIDARATGTAVPWVFGITGTGVARTYDGGTVRTGGQLVASAWNHVAWVRASNVNTVYVNGVSGHTWTASQDFGSSKPILVGDNIGGGEPFAGYISNLRIVKGTAVYTSAFTPPTAPLTAITNTSLLCNFTNGGIIDNAMMNNLETVGNAQISTAQSRFGGGSMYFDGNGDWLQLQPSSQNFNFGTGDYTIEAWVYQTNRKTDTVPIFQTAGSNSSGLVFGLGAGDGVPPAGNLAVYSNGGFIISSTSQAVSLNTWTHVAVTRASGTTRVFINGTVVGSSTTSYNPAFSNPIIGVNSSYTPAIYQGYIDDLRITKGYARYTANFTPPTEAFPLQ